MLSTAGCGTRLSHNEVTAAAGSTAAVARTDIDQNAAAIGDESALPDAAESAGASSVADTPANAVQSGSSSARSTGGAGVRTNPQGAVGSGKAAVAAGSKLVLGFVGTITGPGGAAWAPIIPGLQAWMRDANVRGGVDGHPVSLIVVDDGADPSRYRASLSDLVENRGVFAFVGNAIAQSDSQAATEYLEKNHIAVIGGDLTQPVFITSPSYFPAGPAHLDLIYSTIAGGVRLSPGKKRFGQMTCREAPACTDAGRVWPQYARQLGLEPVYEAQVSIAQPDFTAECLSARNARVELLAVAVDPNGMGRVAQACARQAYRPTFLLPSAVIASNQNGNQYFEGTIGVVSTVPWPATTTPGARAFHDAMQRYAGSAKLNTSSTYGWAAGKLFELAASKGLGSPPSRDRLLDNLFQTKDETLDGVSPPLSFERGKPKHVRCWFSMRFQQGQWRAANDGRYACP